MLMESNLNTTPINKQQKEFLLVLGHLYTQHTKYTDAKIVFEALLLFFPKDYHIMRSLAYAYLNDGDYEHALEMNERSKHPMMTKEDNAFFFLIQSKALWRIGKTHEAKQAFNQFLSTHS
jgi:uncharacterized protein HemY